MRRPGKRLVIAAIGALTGVIVAGVGLARRRRPTDAAEPEHSALDQSREQHDPEGKL